MSTRAKYTGNVRDLLLSYDHQVLNCKDNTVLLTQIVCVVKLCYLSSFEFIIKKKLTKVQINQSLALNFPKNEE